jgi:3-phosphoshikimate 1-carboxyvinyltransferase
MNIKIIPHALNGSVSIPASKSAAHRNLICAALARGESRITPYCTSVDIKATVAALRAIGADICDGKEGYTAKMGSIPESAEIDFYESGSTARFLMPVAAALGINAKMTGRGRLPGRPMKVLCDLLREHGVSVSADNLPITISGKMTAGVFALPGNISSQYITGIMLAAPLMEGETEIVLTTPLQSVGYIDMTIAAMARFGVLVEPTEKGWRIPSGQSYKPCDMKTEGDWSAAAFFMSAAAIGGDIRISGLDFASAQGDMAALDVFAAFGADITIEDNVLHIKKGDLRGIEVNAANIPDMVPAIAATAAFAKGDTIIKNAKRLRLKESDRIKTTVAALKALGVEAKETDDGMEIHGGKVMGGNIDGSNDHRIVMAFSVAASHAKNESTVSDAEASAKSYPEFFEVFKSLEGIANEI